MKTLGRALLLAVAVALAGGCGGVQSRPHSSTPTLVQAPSFAKPVDYPTGRDPAAVAVADLNGDGRGTS